jgi:hypothetical protein
MPFGIGKHDDTPEPPAANGVHATALVTDTEVPITNHWLGHPNPASLAQTRILVNLGKGPVAGMRGLALDADHWLTEGMSVPVIADPANPNDYVVDWSAVPPMQQRAADGDTSLLDPLGAKIRNWDALAKAGFGALGMDQVAPQLVEQTAAAMRARLVSESEAFVRQLADEAKAPASAGFTRALVLIATTTSRFEGTSFGDNMHREVIGEYAVVLSVNIPGKPPYALFLEKFDHQESAYDPNNPGLPALVSTTDPTNVQVLWDEAPTDEDQVYRAEQQTPGYTDAASALFEQHSAALATPLPIPADAVPGATHASQLSPEMKATMTANAQRAIQILPPAARPGLIAYYHTLGIELDS